MAAHDGLAALQRLKTRTPDLILADLRMPGMDGLAFARRVKADAQWRSVPIVAVTALGSLADLHATREAGFAAHALKPIQWEPLIRTIHRVLLRPRPRSEPRRQAS